MPFGGVHGLGKVLAKYIGGKTWQGGESAGVNRLGPSGQDEDESTVMDILDQVDLGPNFVGSASLERRKRRRNWS